MAEAGSSRWASSTPTATVRPAARSVNDTAAARITSSPPPLVAGGNNRATAANGMVAADAVATHQSVSAPPASADASASRANRVLPTPGGPASTTPPPSCNPARRSCNSCPRPTSGQPGPIAEGYAWS